MNGQGTTFGRSSDGISYSTMAKIADISAPEVTRGSSEQSYIDDPAGWKEHTPGLKDGGEIEATLKWNPDDTGQQELKADLELNDNVHYRIVYPDGTADEFMGHITSWGKDLSKEDDIMRKVKIKISGAVNEVAVV